MDVNDDNEYETISDESEEEKEVKNVANIRSILEYGDLEQRIF